MSSISWIAVHVEAFARPTSNLDIMRGQQDAAMLLHHMADAYPSLPFKRINIPTTPLRCRANGEPLSKLMYPIFFSISKSYLIMRSLEKLFEDPSTHFYISTCLIVYGNGSSIVKLASGDFGLREYFFLNKLKQSDPARFDIFFPDSWTPFVDALTGSSASSVSTLKTKKTISVTELDFSCSWRGYLRHEEHKILREGVPSVCG